MSTSCKKEPIWGTILLTDRCNLSCRHCGVNNLTKVIHPYRQIKGEMEQLYETGGSHPLFLWPNTPCCSPETSLF